MNNIKNFFQRNKGDERRSDQPMSGGRRDGESENPYLSARRTWNDYTGSQIAARRMWQAVALSSLMVVLVAVGGVIQIGSQSKFIPYVVEVDKVGKAVAAGPVTSTTKVDPRLIKSAVAGFISDARLVTPDVALQRAAVFRVYARLSPSDPATQKMNDWLNSTPDSSPFKRAAKEMVSIEIESVMPQTPDTWQVDWKETTRDRQGALVGNPASIRALITVYNAEPAPGTTEEQMDMNPLGIYVRDYSWSKLL